MHALYDIPTRQDFDWMVLRESTTLQRRTNVLILQPVDHFYGASLPLNVLVCFLKVQFASEDQALMSRPYLSKSITLPANANKTQNNDLKISAETCILK